VVCPFADGADALRLLESMRFELIISDVDMVEVDGMELLLRIHQRGRHMPVLMISGGGFMARDEVLALGRAGGAVATLGKPFTVEELRETVEPLLPAAVAGL
jgi:CheY-like chemotaxis protein